MNKTKFMWTAIILLMIGIFSLPRSDYNSSSYKVGGSGKYVSKSKNNVVKNYSSSQNNAKGETSKNEGETETVENTYQQNIISDENTYNNQSTSISQEESAQDSVILNCEEDEFNYFLVAIICLLLGSIILTILLIILTINIVSKLKNKNKKN